MDKEVLKQRTKIFGLQVIKLIESLPNTITGNTIAKQLIRAGTSVGANYRAACRGRSKSEFIAKLGTVLEKADECCYWLEVIKESQLLPSHHTNALYKEADELTAIFSATLRNIKNPKS